MVSTYTLRSILEFYWRNKLFFLTLGCADTCDDSVSAIKAFVDTVDPGTVAAAANTIGGYLGVDGSEVLDFANNFDWCAEIAAHPAGDAFCEWTHSIVEEYSK